VFLGLSNDDPKVAAMEERHAAFRSGGWRPFIHLRPRGSGPSCRPFWNSTAGPVVQGSPSACFLFWPSPNCLPPEVERLSTFFYLLFPHLHRGGGTAVSGLLR
jgi:hypothetical protein